eukprot:scaffold22238_cov62-Phaeocystis_antarctica.AAC.6
MSEAMSMALRPIISASYPSTSSSALAAAVAKAPPEPMPMTPLLGSMTSPVPVSVSETSLSTTIMTASRRRRYLSMRHALAISMHARMVSGCSLSFISSRSKRVIASAVAPANPHATPSRSTRTLRAFGLMTCEPRVTCPSPIKNCARSLRVSLGRAGGGAAVHACAPLCCPCARIGSWSSGSACHTSRRSRYRWCAFCATSRPRTRGARRTARRQTTAPPRGRAGGRGGFGAFFSAISADFR